jgi:hypothetical protein
MIVSAIPKKIKLLACTTMTLFYLQVPVSKSAIAFSRRRRAKVEIHASELFAIVSSALWRFIELSMIVAAPSSKEKKSQN